MLSSVSEKQTVCCSSTQHRVYFYTISAYSRLMYQERKIMRISILRYEYVLCYVLYDYVL
jgi:hypothetical protein